MNVNFSQKNIRKEDDNDDDKKKRIDNRDNRQNFRGRGLTPRGGGRGRGRGSETQNTNTRTNVEEKINNNFTSRTKSNQRYESNNTNNSTTNLSKKTLTRNRNDTFQVSNINNTGERKTTIKKQGNNLRKQEESNSNSSITKISNTRKQTKPTQSNATEHINTLMRLVNDFNFQRDQKDVEDLVISIVNCQDELIDSDKEQLKNLFSCNKPNISKLICEQLNELDFNTIPLKNLCYLAISGIDIISSGKGIAKIKQALMDKFVLFIQQHVQDLSLSDIDFVATSYVEWKKQEPELINIDIDLCNGLAQQMMVGDPKDVARIMNNLLDIHKKDTIKNEFVKNFLDSYNQALKNVQYNKTIAMNAIAVIENLLRQNKFFSVTATIAQTFIEHIQDDNLPKIQQEIIGIMHAIFNKMQDIKDKDFKKEIKDMLVSCLTKIAANEKVDPKVVEGFIKTLVINKELVAIFFRALEPIFQSNRLSFTAINLCTAMANMLDLTQMDDNKILVISNFFARVCEYCSRDKILPLNIGLVTAVDIVNDMNGQFDITIGDFTNTFRGIIEVNNKLIDICVNRCLAYNKDLFKLFETTIIGKINVIKAKELDKLYSIDKHIEFLKDFQSVQICLFNLCDGFAKRICNLGNINTLEPNTICTIANLFARFGINNTELFETIRNYVDVNLTNMHAEDLCSIMWSLIVSGNIDPQDSEGVTFLNKLAGQIYNKCNFIKNNDISIKQVRSTLRFFTDFNNSNNINDLFNFVKDKGKPDEATISNLQRDITECVEKIYIQQEVRSEEQIEDFLVDIFVLPNTIIEVQGPHHYYNVYIGNNEPERQFRGTDKFKEKMLLNLGYTIKYIHFFDWDSSQEPDVKENLLRNLLNK